MRNIKAADWGRSLEPIHQKMSGSSAQVLALSGSSTAIFSPRNYHNFAKEGYTENPEAHACINWLSTSVKGLNFNVYQKQTNGKREIVDPSHPFAQLIKNPNPQMGTSAYFEAWVIYLMCAGNVFVERAGPYAPNEATNKPPKELWLQRPDRIDILKGNPQQPIKGYQYKPDYMNSGKPWLADDIRIAGGRAYVQKLLHSKFFNPVDDWFGLSAMEVAGRAIDQINTAQEWNVALLQNGARPSGLLTIENLDPEQQPRIEEEFHRKYGGTVNAGRTIIASGSDVKYASFSQTAQEISWAEGQDQALRRICSVFKVPVEMLGANSGRTYQNWAEARRSFYMEGVLPLTDFMVSEHNRWLQPFYGDEFELGYDPESIEALQEDRTYVHQRALEGLKAGAITRNMYLTMIGEDPLPANVGDVFLVPTTSMPMSLSGKPIASALPPAPQIAARKPNAAL